MVNASIITIGDELLIGQVIDTNSAYIAQNLLPKGIVVTRRLSVGDRQQDIIDALNLCLSDSRVVIITGGLGPTADDITKPVLCAYFGGSLVMNETVGNQIIDLFENKLKRPVSERNLQQAVVPDNCKVLFNPVGTAPGMVFEKNGQLVFSLPGVPHEMKHLLQHDVVPLLMAHYELRPVLYKTVMVSGIPESDLADVLIPFESQLPSGIQLAYLPNFGVIRLRLTAYNADEDVLQQQTTQLQQAVSEYLIVPSDKKLEEVVAEKLLSAGATLATAESCTGGYIAHTITRLPGASRYYLGGTVVYSNALKEKLLQVKSRSLEEHGAVSEPVVIEMVQGSLQHLKADYAVAISGILGPDGGTSEKPVGTVWLAAGNAKKVITKKIHLRYNRETNIEAASIQALLLLLQSIHEGQQIQEV